MKSYLLTQWFVLKLGCHAWTISSEENTLILQSFWCVLYCQWYWRSEEHISVEAYRSLAVANDGDQERIRRIRLQGEDGPYQQCSNTTWFDSFLLEIGVNLYICHLFFCHSYINRWNRRKLETDRNLRKSSIVVTVCQIVDCCHCLSNSWLLSRFVK